MFFVEMESENCISKELNNNLISIFKPNFFTATFVQGLCRGVILLYLDM